MDSDGKFETCLSSEEGRGRRREYGEDGGTGGGEEMGEAEEGKTEEKAKGGREGREDETEGVITRRSRNCHHRSIFIRWHQSRLMLVGGRLSHRHARITRRSVLQRRLK
ncbi:unnamed protein product, partial [Musa hybrid cultivar]